MTNQSANTVSIPKWGEIRYGTVPQTDESLKRHEYVGKRPFLIISNNVFNAYSDVVSCIPFTTKRWNSVSPAHVFFKSGEVEGLSRDSTLMCENETVVCKNELSESIGKLTEEQLKMVAKACTMQKPMLALAGDVSKDEKFQRLSTI